MVFLVKNSMTKIMLQQTYLVTNGDAANGLHRLIFNGRLTYTRDGNEYTVAEGISLLTPGIFF